MLTDIYQKLESDFGEKSSLAIEALDQLDAETKGFVGPRLVRAMLYLAKGDIGALRRVIDLARQDWRDVLLQAEYSYPDNTRVRDFEKTFHELQLIDKKNSGQSKP